MIDDRVRLALKNDIAARLLAGGPKRWKELQNRYPQVSSATFFRLVGEVKGERGGEAAGPSGDPVQDAAEIVPRISSLPSGWAADDPGFTTSLPPDRLIGEIARLFDDANLLRSYALDSQGKIKDPVAFATSAKLRDRAIRTAFDLLAGIYDIENQADWLDAFVEVVSAADSETSKRVILALHEIQTRNFTPIPKIKRGISGGGAERIE